jgi:hypothetical protein
MAQKYKSLGQESTCFSTLPAGFPPSTPKEWLLLQLCLSSPGMGIHPGQLGVAPYAY